ncbi:MAG TPA: hypothetical protein PKL15_08485 [Saprospiraceae bacterium]|nr:hypothetical protein [Saprospiraceae bacterium]HNM25452.1 hypothetical protein [Saprospiraceae bacterium]
MKQFLLPLFFLLSLYLLSCAKKNDDSFSAAFIGAWSVQGELRSVATDTPLDSLNPARFSLELSEQEQGVIRTDQYERPLNWRLTEDAQSIVLTGTGIDPATGFSYGDSSLQTVVYNILYQTTLGGEWTSSKQYPVIDTSGATIPCRVHLFVAPR